MTDTEAGLLRAVLDDPASDLPRLVLADYWEENGQTERGEFVRVQCELARAEEAGCPGQTPEGARVNALRRREGELWTWHGPSFIKSLPREMPALHKNGLATASLVAAGIGSAVEYQFARGFVEHVTAPLAVLFGGECGRCRSPGWGHSHGTIVTAGPTLSTCPDCKGAGRTPGVAPALWACQPVARVTLSDRKPWLQAVMPEFAGWWDRAPQHEFSDDGDVLPDELMELMADDPRRCDLGISVRFCKRPNYTPGGCILFPSEAAALDALSAACVALGRSVAAGHRHGVCEGCEGKRQFFAGGTFWDCEDCDGTGTRPGLPPLRGEGVTK